MWCKVIGLEGIEQNEGISLVNTAYALIMLLCSDAYILSAILFATSLSAVTEVFEVVWFTFIL